MLSLELESNNHLVLVIKYRRKVISDEVSSRLKEIFEYISTKYNKTINYAIL